MVKQGFIILMVVFFIIFLTSFFSKPSLPFFESSVGSSLLSQRSITIAGKNLKVEIADSEEKRSKGLSGRKNLPEDLGMLFLFETPDKYSFWMKDMKFSLDIIWIDKNKKVIAVSENISPDTYPASFSPSDSVKYVLEVRAGWTRKNGVRVGDSIEL